jgi:hypothetical protein
MITIQYDCVWYDDDNFATPIILHPVFCSRNPFDAVAATPDSTATHCEPVLINVSI